jgi:hypothetical protein
MARLAAQLFIFTFHFSLFFFHFLLFVFHFSFFTYFGRAPHYVRVATLRGSLRSVLRTPTGPPGGSRKNLVTEAKHLNLVKK